MATFAQGSRTRLGYIVETVFGTTPGTPSILLVPYNTHSLTLAKDRVQGEEIRGDRVPVHDRHGNKHVSGDIVVEFRDTDYDDFIESAMFSAFDSTGDISVGTTPKYMTLEEGALDIDMHRNFTGCAVNSMKLAVAPNQMVMMTFGMIGQDMNTTGATPLDATPTDPSSADPMDSYQGTITLPGSGGADTIVSALEMNVINSLNPAFSIGSASAQCLEYGNVEVSGSMTIYYDSQDEIDRFVDETTGGSLVLVLTDGTNTYTFTAGNVKFNGADAPVANPQSRFITIPWVALGPTGATILSIAKT